METDSNSSINMNDYDLRNNKSAHDARLNDKKTPYEFFKRDTETSFAKSFNNYLKRRRNLSAGPNRNSINERDNSLNNLYLLQKLNESSFGSPQKKFLSGLVSPQTNLSSTFMSPQIVMSSNKKPKHIRNVNTNDLQTDQNSIIKHSKKENLLENEQLSINESNSSQYQTSKKFFFTKNINHKKFSPSIDLNIENTDAADKIEPTITVMFSSVIKNLQNFFFKSIDKLNTIITLSKQQSQSQITKFEKLIKFTEENNYFKSEELRNIITNLCSYFYSYGNYASNFRLETESIVDLSRELFTQYDKETEEKLIEANCNYKKIFEVEKFQLDQQIQQLKNEIENLKYEIRIKNSRLFLQSTEGDDEPNNFMRKIFNSGKKLFSNADINKEQDDFTWILRKENESSKDEIDRLHKSLREMQDQHTNEIQNIHKEFSEITSRNLTTESLEKDVHNLRHQLRITKEQNELEIQEITNLLNSKEKLRMQQKLEWKDLLKNFNKQFRDIKNDNNFLRIENKKMMKKLGESVVYINPKAEIQIKYQENLQKYRSKKEECRSLWKVIGDLKDLLLQSIQFTDFFLIFRNYGLDKKARYMFNLQ